jgi:hypothetical protein
MGKSEPTESFLAAIAVIKLYKHLPFMKFNPIFEGELYYKDRRNK